MRRKTPAVTAGGGKREAAGDSRRWRGGEGRGGRVIGPREGNREGESNAPPPPPSNPRTLLSHPRRPRITSLAYFLPSLSLDLLCNRVYVRTF